MVHGCRTATKWPSTLVRRSDQVPRRRMAMVVTTCSLRISTAFVMPHRSHVYRLANSCSSTSTSFDDLMAEVLNPISDINKTAQSDAETNTGWRRLSWRHEIMEPVATAPSLPSPVDVVMIRDRLVYIKRDDEVRLPGSQINGNKARKMLALEQIDDPALFPACVASYGGPQSNAMLALAAVVHYQNTRLEATVSNDTGTVTDSGARRKRFVYYTKVLPRFLKNQPSGNLFRALALGMELVELTADEYNSLFGNEWGGTGERAPLALAPLVPHDSVWIPQGGASAMALVGTRQLAREVYNYWTDKGAGQPLSLCIPGGTCTTALLTHHALRDLQTDRGAMDIQVVVIPCVGDESYARRQMMYLNAQIFGKNVDDIPTILRPAQKQSSGRTSDYFRFGEPDRAILSTFRELRNEHDVVLDLLYGAPAWTILLRHWTSSLTSTMRNDHPLLTSFDPEAPLDGRRVMYVHSGGLEGINSQLLRYKYKNLVDKDEIQLPGRRGSSDEKNEEKNEAFNRPNLDILPFLGKPN